MLVYVFDSTATSDAFDKIENVVLKDERVALASRAFTCIKMTPDDAVADPIVTKQGKETPRMVLVSADYKNAMNLEKSRLTGGGLWDAMKVVSDKHYAKSLESAVKEMRELLIEVDKIYGERKTLQEKRQRLEEKGTEAEKKAVDTKIAALDERQKKVDERQAALWEMKRKLVKEAGKAVAKD